MEPNSFFDLAPKTCLVPIVNADPSGISFITTPMRLPEQWGPLSTNGIEILALSPALLVFNRLLLEVIMSLTCLHSIRKAPL